MKTCKLVTVALLVFLGALVWGHRAYASGEEFSSLPALNHQTLEHREFPPSGDYPNGRTVEWIRWQDGCVWVGWFPEWSNGVATDPSEAPGGYWEGSQPPAPAAGETNEFMDTRYASGAHWRHVRTYRRDGEDRYDYLERHVDRLEADKDQNPPQPLPDPGEADEHSIGESAIGLGWEEGWTGGWLRVNGRWCQTTPGTFVSMVPELGLTEVQ